MAEIEELNNILEELDGYTGTMSAECISILKRLTLMRIKDLKALQQIEVTRNKPICQGAGKRNVRTKPTEDGLV